jgi:hypothetical protein
MQENTLSKETAEVRGYYAPGCRVIPLVTQRVICGSETEVVGEDEGEW